MMIQKFAGILGLLLTPLVIAEPTTLPADTQPTKIIEKTIPASAHRPLKQSKTPEIAALLKKFEVPPQAFRCRMEQIGESDSAVIWRVTFSSPWVSPDPVNNTVWCEYYQSKAAGRRPAVILLHPLDLRASMMRDISEKMSKAGMDCLWMEMAYYDRRAPGGLIDLLGMVKNFDRLKSAVCQTVMDVRRASEFLVSQPNVEPKKIYLMGCSLGALVSSLTMGVDGEYSKVVLLLGGGDIAKIMVVNEVCMNLLKVLHQGRVPSYAEISDRLKLIEPLTYIERAKGVKVLMINNSGDTVIPPECSRKLAENLPHAEIKWYEGNHARLPIDELVPMITKFYQER